MKLRRVLTVILFASTQEFLKNQVQTQVQLTEGARRDKSRHRKYSKQKFRSRIGDPCNSTTI